MVSYHSLEVISPLWIVAAHKAAQQSSAFGLCVPDGMSGGWSLNYFPLSEGGVRFTLSFRDKETRKSQQVAKWIGDTLPTRDNRPRAPIKTHGKPIIIDADDRTGDVCAKVVRVVVDDDGLPVPVPEVMLRRSTAEQVADWLRSLGVMVDGLRVLEVQRKMAMAT